MLVLQQTKAIDCIPLLITITSEVVATMHIYISYLFYYIGINKQYTIQRQHIKLPLGGERTINLAGNL